MYARKALLCAAIAAATALPAAASYAYDEFRVQIGTGPVYEPAPAPRAGYVWVPGYRYRDGWVAGHWERAPHYVYEGHYSYDYPYNRNGWDDRQWAAYGGWDGRHRDHFSYNEDPRGYLRFDR